MALLMPSFVSVYAQTSVRENPTVEGPVKGPTWTYTDNAWYIYNRTLYAGKNRSDKYYSVDWTEFFENSYVYIPVSSDNTKTLIWKALHYQGVNPVTYLVKIGGENVTGVVGTQKKGTNDPLPYEYGGGGGSNSWTLMTDQGTAPVTMSGYKTIKAGWESDMTYGDRNGNQRKKSFEVKIPLQKHLDFVNHINDAVVGYNDGSSDPLDVIDLGWYNVNVSTASITQTVELYNYIKSFYIDAPITLSISGTGYSMSGNTTLVTTPTSDNVAVFAKSDCFNTGSGIGSLTGTSRTITFNPVPCANMVQSTCTLNITYKGVSKKILLVANNKDYIFEGTSDDNWSNPENWNVNALPNENVDVTIDAACKVSDNSAECANLQFTENGSLTITTEGALNVAEELTNTDPEKLHIEADENGSGTVIFGNIDGCDNGPWAKVDLYIPLTTEATGVQHQGYKWRYMGAPVKEGAVQGISDKYIYQWDEGDHGSDGYYSECWLPVSGNISRWNGYAMATTETGAYITGQLINCEDATYALDFGSGDHDHADKGNNLITNSFSAPIKLGNLTTDNFGGANATIYFFNSGTHSDWKNNQNGRPGTLAGQYQAFPVNSFSTTTIPAGQAFFVEATATGQTFHFTYSSVVASASGAAYAPKKQDEFNVLQVNIVGTDSLGDLLWLMENENCSEKFDNGYDGLKKLGVEGTPQIYATNKFGRTSVNVDQTITGQYLGFMAGKNGVHYTISFNTDRLEGYDELYLYDTQENKYVNIIKGETYTFTGKRSGEEKRFLIVGQREDEEDDVVTRTGDERRIEVVGNQALVMGFDGSDADVRVVDMQGRTVCEWNMKEGPWFELPDLPGGVYVISVEKCQTKFVK